MVSGYSDSMQNKVEGNANDILKTHGTAVNEILSQRADVTLRTEKEKGSVYADEYLAQHPEAVRTESGLIFHETQAGSGEPPAEVSGWVSEWVSQGCDRECCELQGVDVLVHYHGTYVNGDVFDSSLDRGEKSS